MIHCLEQSVCFHSIIRSLVMFSKIPSLFCSSFGWLPPLPLNFTVLEIMSQQQSLTTKTYRFTTSKFFFTALSFHLPRVSRDMLEGWALLMYPTQRGQQRHWSAIVPILLSFQLEYYASVLFQQEQRRRIFCPFSVPWNCWYLKIDQEKCTRAPTTLVLRAELKNTRKYNAADAQRVLSQVHFRTNDRFAWPSPLEKRLSIAFSHSSSTQLLFSDCDPVFDSHMSYSLSASLSPTITLQIVFSATCLPLSAADCTKV